MSITIIKSESSKAVPTCSSLSSEVPSAAAVNNGIVNAHIYNTILFLILSIYWQMTSRSSRPNCKLFGIYSIFWFDYHTISTFDLWFPPISSKIRDLAFNSFCKINQVETHDIGCCQVRILHCSWQSWNRIWPIREAGKNHHPIRKPKRCNPSWNLDSKDEPDVIHPE